MRIMPLLAATLLLTAAGSTATFAASSREFTRIAASTASCDAQRKACYAGKTQTDSNGVRYVPPDAVAECEGAYRMCTKGH